MPRSTASAVLLLSLALLPACDLQSENRSAILEQYEYKQSLAAVAELRPCADGSRPRPEWTQHNRGPFSFRLPSEYQQEEVQGIDSYVESYRAPGREFGFDYGPYSDPLIWHGSDMREFQACRTSVDGHLVKLVTARMADGTYLAGAAWRELDSKSQGNLHLTMHVRSETTAAQQEALGIFRSVRFRKQ